MKLEVLERAATTAHEQARRLKSKAQQLDLVARTAKEKARQAKARLKLAKREVKHARSAAKDAKRALAEVLSVCEKAATDAADLEKKIQKTRQAEEKNGKARRSRGNKPVAAKRNPSRRKSLAAKSNAKPNATAVRARAKLF